MNDVDEVGYYIRIQKTKDYLERDKGMKGRNNREIKTKLKQPLFQFRFDIFTGKFVRELKDSINIDNLKNPQFQAGQFSNVELDNDETESPSKTNKSNNENNNYLKNLAGDDEDYIVQITEKSEHVSQKLSLDLLTLKKSWGNKIQIYRLQNGKFINKDAEEEQKKLIEFQKQQNLKLQQAEHSQQSIKIFKSSLKSRKDLLIALNQQKTPKALRSIQIVMNVAILAAAVLSIIEFSFNNMEYNNINQNFMTIENSYTRIAEFQRIAYDVRSIILINEQKFTNYQQYTTYSSFPQFLIDDISSALNNLYALENQISLSTSTNIAAQLELLETNSVLLQFRSLDQSALKTIAFNLNEAVEQMASATFTVKNLNISQIVSSQDDTFFITLNTYNDLLVALRYSAQYYVNYQNSLIQQKQVNIIILFSASIFVILVACIVLTPVIRDVNQSRTVILTLLVDIPNSNIFQFISQCESFISFLENEGEEDEQIDNQPSEADTEITDQANSQWVSYQPTHRNQNKIPINLKLSYQKFILQVLILSSFTLTYYVLMFVLNIDYVGDISHINGEIGIIAQAEQYYMMTQNIIRERIYDPTQPILDSNSFNIALDSLEELQQLNSKILDDQFSNRMYNDASFDQIFQDLYHSNLCIDTYQILNLTLYPQNCSTMFSDVATYGLQTVVVRYTETLKKLFKTYLEYQDQGINVNTLFNSDYFKELFVLQFGLIKNVFRKLVDSMLQQINDNYNNKLNLRIIGFIVFLAFLIVGYFFVWIPYLSRLKKEIQRTKQMITIVPIEVISKLPKIQEYILNESVVAVNDQTMSQTNSTQLKIDNVEQDSD